MSEIGGKSISEMNDRTNTVKAAANLTDSQFKQFQAATN